MKDEQVRKGFYVVYNKFWLKHKNQIPTRESEDWERLHAEALALQKEFPVLAKTVNLMEIELDERMRTGGNHELRNSNAEDKTHPPASG